MIEVIKAGALTTIQDRGRFGWAHLGVPCAGALDTPALARANALVGNDPDAAGLEITLTGCTLRFRTPAVVAVTGAPAALAVDGEDQPRHTPFPVRATATLRIGPASAGVRTYLAVRGGIDVPPVLGSRSRDTLAGIGPAPLRNGDLLPIGSATPELRTVTEIAALDRDDETVVELRIRFGPRDDWFEPSTRDVLCGSAYTLTMSSNRVGARLAGVPLVRANAAELPSEGIVLGAVQVAPDGQPIVFLADHPTTGGYPVIGVVDPRDVSRLAQVRPGGVVRFRTM